MEKTFFGGAEFKIKVLLSLHNRHKRYMLDFYFPDLIKKQQTIQELRWTIIKKDEKIKELNTLETKMAILENKLKEFDEMKFQKETLTMQVETQKRSIKGMQFF